MYKVPHDVLLNGVVPFLQLRDLKSLLAVSRSIHLLKIKVQLTHDLNRYICGYIGCSNRFFLYTTVDPFVDFVGSFSSFPITVLHFSKILFLFPLYCTSFCRIIYHLYHNQQHVPETRIALGYAIVSYMTMSKWIETITSTQASQWCTCIDRMERHRDHKNVTCAHSDLCTLTTNGGCIPCILDITIDNLQCRISELPSTFYIHAFFFIIPLLFFFTFFFLICVFSFMVLIILNVPFMTVILLIC
jgi:hypothetical protein